MIEDKPTWRLKRYFQKAQRKVWRADKWLSNHSRFYPGHSAWLQDKQFWRERAEFARDELKHRDWTVI